MKQKKKVLSKLTLGLVFLLVLVLGVVGSSHKKSKMDLTVGGEVYACKCGEKCDCDTLCDRAGKCSCGVELVKSKVKQVDKDKGTAVLEVQGKERTFKTMGKYVCGCPADCCNIISQKPGKCPCGVDLKAVSKT